MNDFQKRADAAEELAQAIQAEKALYWADLRKNFTECRHMAAEIECTDLVAAILFHAARTQDNQDGKALFGALVLELIDDDIENLAKTACTNAQETEDDTLIGRGTFN